MVVVVECSVWLHRILGTGYSPRYLLRHTSRCLHSRQWGGHAILIATAYGHDVKVTCYKHWVRTTAFVPFINHSTKVKTLSRTQEVMVINSYCSDIDVT